ncbi:NAD(P)/FAD-dependent oxidoreductase [Pedobacter duraquae]|uniref:Thioredoxin reductase n=1 Tax=Pedobacter duraquae TaxID=425511 RepID=A0A4R6IK65_9SPHI|nr:NAD(P)/FAD-dependent oxidoreductase [Pedobacter duraquae]TDO22454.1 thioredoxin reductase [Pedobacter duraquae]
MDKNNLIYDALIVGGSYAGLSAALGLGRARRKVLVIDHGMPCNRQTPHSHNFLTQDGSTPAEISALAKAQVSAYPTVQIMNDTVAGVSGENMGFAVSLADGGLVRAKKIIFATGIQDLMPDIPGFKESWGISVIHCPYCHGYEYSDQPTGLLLNGDAAFDFGQVIRNWTDQLTIFTNGVSTLSSAQTAELQLLGIMLNEIPIKSVSHTDGHLTGVTLSNEDQVPLAAMYARLPFKQHSQIPVDLGCGLNALGYLEVDDMQRTTVAGIFAAGDNASPFRSVAGAVAAGAKTAAMLNHDLIMGK